MSCVLACCFFAVYERWQWHMTGRLDGRTGLSSWSLSYTIVGQHFILAKTIHYLESRCGTTYYSSKPRDVQRLNIR